MAILRMWVDETLFFHHNSFFLLIYLFHCISFYFFFFILPSYLCSWETYILQDKDTDCIHAI
jgi:hypothetical protein